MKRLTYIFLTFITLASYSNNMSKTSDNNATQIDSIKQVFSPLINGVWILKDYIDAIEKTKSPLQSAKKLQGIVTMIIDVTSLSDSIEVGASWNNHEGYNFTTYFITGQKPSSLKTNILDYDDKSNFYELGYENVQNRVYLVLYHYNKAKKLIDKKLFSKVADKQADNDAAWGLQFIVNEKLFSGDYLLIDSSNSLTNITFKSDGSLTGDSHLKTYYIFTDFLGGTRTILDGIAFNVNEKDMEWYAFIIEKGTTYLYSTIGNEEAGELLKLDKLKYTLVRQ